MFRSLSIEYLEGRVTESTMLAGIAPVLRQGKPVQPFPWARVNEATEVGFKDIDSPSLFARPTVDDKQNSSKVELEPFPE